MSWWRQRKLLPAEVEAADVASRREPVIVNGDTFREVCKDITCYITSGALQNGTITATEDITVKE